MLYPESWDSCQFERGVVSEGVLAAVFEGTHRQLSQVLMNPLRVPLKKRDGYCNGIGGMRQLTRSSPQPRPRLRMTSWGVRSLYLSAALVYETYEHVGAKG
jgi:hypothetical protein